MLANIVLKTDNRGTIRRYPGDEETGMQRIRFWILGEHRRKCHVASKPTIKESLIIRHISTPDAGSLELEGFPTL